MQGPAPQVAAPGRLARALPLSAALASTLALIVPVLRPEAQLYYRDTARLYYPVKHYIAERLARGQLPLWDPWTESGVSLLGQISPGLFHPFTLLYLLLPFDLAFKLNHLFALPLAAAGAYWFARELGTSPWPSAAAGIVFGCSGYLVSTSASNLPYALGPASIPAACAGLLWLCEKPSAKRLLGSSLLLALCNYSGEPQSALFAATIGGACALGVLQAGANGLRERVRRAALAAGLTALWATTALALSMPAVLPGGLRAHDSKRWSGLSAEERSIFSVHPFRLLAFAVPRAFDDALGDDALETSPTPYAEYLSTVDRASFADSICLGAPAILLALFAFSCDRRGRALALGGAVFALAATGEALGVNAWLIHLLPGFNLFRYAEKLIGPASLLIALAAARGVERALSADKRAALRLSALAALAGVSLFATRACLSVCGPAALDFLMVHGRTHAHAAAARMLALLDGGLALSATLSLALALIAAHRAFSPRKPWVSPALACACCFASAMTYASDLLFTLPVELLRTKPLLAQELERRAGPSEGRWRLLSTADPVLEPARWHDARSRSAAQAVNVLAPQLDALFHIEGAAIYFSLYDDHYITGFDAALPNFATLFDVRFVTTDPVQMSERLARQLGFEKAAGVWLRENPPRPRAFLVARAFRAPQEGALAVLADRAFDPTRSALVETGDQRAVGNVSAAGPLGEAKLQRASPEKIDIETDSAARRLLVVAEHFDPGWRATVDGEPAPLLRVDTAALGLPLAAGHHRVHLEFWPVGFTAGLSIAAATAAVFALWLALAARRRGPVASAG